MEKRSTNNTDIKMTLETNIQVILITIVGFASLMNSIVLFKYWECFIKWLDKKAGCNYSTWKFRIFNFLCELLGCPNCLTFWSVLIYTQNPLFAGMGFITSKIIEDYIWKKK